MPEYSEQGEPEEDQDQRQEHRSEEVVPEIDAKQAVQIGMVISAI